MSNTPRSGATRRARRIRLLILLLGTTLAGTMFTTSAAQADWYFSKSKAERAAKHYVSNRYANTYASNLVVTCDPVGEAYDPSYKYHAWKCYWLDVSDDNVGAVRIVGRRGSGYYVGRVIRGAQPASLSAQA
jgi:hypothetical protein